MQNFNTLYMPLPFLYKLEYTQHENNSSQVSAFLAIWFLWRFLKTYIPMSKFPSPQGIMIWTNLNATWGRFHKSFSFPANKFSLFLLEIGRFSKNIKIKIAMYLFFLPSLVNWPSGSGEEVKTLMWNVKSLLWQH